MILIRLAIWLLLVVILLLVPACAHTPREGELILTTVPAPSLEGALFPSAAEQPLMVYLPAAYRRGGTAFPVLYYLPGFTTDVTEYLDQSFQGLSLRVTMDELIRLGRIRPMIVVVLNGRNFLGGSFYVNSPVTGAWEDYVVHDVVGHVDRTWRTIASPASRGVAGDSMGASGAIRLAMNHPDLFGAVYAMSPGLLPGDGVLASWLFTDEAMIRDDLRLIGELHGLPEDQARERFRSFIEGLYASGGREGYFRAFAWAYGAAFAPDVASGPPWIDYPFALRDGEVIVDEAGMARFDAGFGGLEAMVAEHGADLRSLHGLVLDVGRDDQLTWIPDGARRLSGLLKEAGVAHELREHDGSHVGSLRWRFEYELLPFFSATLRSPATTLAPAG